MRAALLLSCLLLAACGTTQVAIPYTPSTTVVPQNRPVIAGVSVIDQRNEQPNWLGTIRGGYGNPLKRIETNGPVKDVVAKAFTDAIAARGLLATAGSGRYDTSVTMHVLDANQYARREANADLQVALIERGSGQQVYTDRIKVNRINGSILALDTGLFASPDDLRQLMAETLDQAIDQTLDKPGFVAALR
jgi:hypothetical protein